MRPVSHQEILVDQIVHEVMRRLDGGGDQPRKDAPRQKVVSAAGQVEIVERVVSVEQLGGRLDNITQMFVRADAIITPAAQDLLNEKGIRVTRGGPSRDSTPGAACIALAVLDTDYDTTKLMQTLEKAKIAARRLTTTDLVAAIDAMTGRTIPSESRGIILTRETEVALCLANRRNCMRAALAANASDVARAIESIGANLLVVDPAGCSLHELLRIVKRFVSGERGNVPVALRASST